jgi:AcrR family transcriptional regulator
MPKQTFFNLPEEKRQGLIEIALDEFANYDYQTASVSRIVARAGIAKGSLYQYFEHKQDLYEYLFELATEKKLAYLNQHQPPDPNMNIFAYLSWLLKYRVGFELAYPRWNKLTYRAVIGDAPLSAEVEDKAKGVATEYIQNLLARGIQRGDIDPAIDPDLGAFVFSAVVVEFGRYLSLRLSADSQADAGDKDLSVESEALQTFFDKLLYILEHGMGRQKMPQEG